MPDHGNITLPPKDRIKIFPKTDNAEKFRRILYYAQYQYFHSGVQVIYMASIYSEESNIEYAFILYSKYIKSFIEQSPQISGLQISCHSWEDKVKKWKNLLFPR